MTPSGNALDALRERKQTSLPSIVRDEIGRMIEAGELLPGAWVNEAELAASLGVSRGVVREACRGLEQHGLLHFVVNRGAFVREIGPEEVSDIYDIRAALFGLAGRTLAPKLDSAGSTALKEIVEAMNAAAEEGNLDAYYPLNLNFHRLIFDLAGNQRLLTIYLGCVRELHLFRRNALVIPNRMMESNREHTEIFAALSRGDAETAGRLMEAHVLRAKSLVLKHQVE